MRELGEKIVVESGMLEFDLILELISFRGG